MYLAERDGIRFILLLEENPDGDGTGGSFSIGILSNPKFIQQVN